MREKIAEIVWNISTSHWGQETTMDFREQQRKKFVSELEALFTAEQKQWGEDLIDYLNYRLSEYTKKEHLFEIIKKWGD